MGRSFDVLTGAMTAKIGAVQAAGSQVATGSVQVSATAQQLSQGTTEQALAIDADRGGKAVVESVEAMKQIAVKIGIIEEI